ncbi:hypothetical protein C2S53_013921 [Perilla frutescens var. hirtella]|uniref:PLAT domain-containing protein n=1 Tax=Perilla frutescens var. hirtella TaxID=608512 RepID=A0AAD4P761_PERFH|nr:hypothetical protein C2S53_013921 [Perilla frutescens var. hirtella]
MEVKHLSFNLLIIIFSFVVYTNANYPECIYNIYVKTGSFPLAGTHSNISLFLSDDTKTELPITNLREWGLMGPAFSYFRPGNIDLFAVKGPCLHGYVCSLIIVLNNFDNWYCDFIEVTSVGFETPCACKHFTVKKWLDDNKGSAVILQDECPSSDDERDDVSIQLRPPIL